MARAPITTISLYRSVLAACMALPGAAPAQDQQPRQLPTTTVKEFKVEGNTLLPSPVLEAALLPFKGERSAEDLRRAEVAVQQAYARAGYGAVVASVPIQDLSSGVVTIRVLEGKLSAVAISGNQQFSQDNVRASLPSLVTGMTPRLDLVDVHIQMANENPAKHVAVLLQPGRAMGDVEAHVTVKEEPVRRWHAGLDNRGNGPTGRWRANVLWQHANVFERDHVLSAQVQVSPDEPSAVKVFAAAYHAPLYESRMALDVFAAYSKVKAGATPTLVGDLQFNGRGRLAGARATRYLARLGEFDQRLGIALDHRDYINSCSIANLPPGACGSAGESVSVQPLSLDYSLQKGGPQSMGLLLSLAHNLQIGGSHASDRNFEAVRLGAKPRYTTFGGSAFASTELLEWLKLYARMAFQITPHALVPGEQFGIGGAASVRGYEERELSGDRGALLSWELQGPNLLPNPASEIDHLRPVAFVDAGWISNRLDTPCQAGRSDCWLYSAGLGVRLAWDRLQSQLHVARAFRTALQTQRDDVRVHFALSYAF